MSTANLRWSFSITSVTTSPLGTTAVSGIARSPDNSEHKFIASDNLDPRFPTRFKVNWNGMAPRMPRPVGHGVKEEVLACTEGHDPSLFIGRGGRVAIARMCRLIVQNNEV
jgi:hypothetical protein